jgi:murein hydrolase activator
MAPTLRASLSLGVALAGLSLAGVALARPEPETIFARINHAEDRTLRASQRVTALGEELKEQDQRIQRFVHEQAELERTSGRMRHKAVQRQIAWEHVRREASRAALMTPPRAEDRVVALLANAEPAAHATQHRELAALANQHEARAHLTSMAMRRTAMTLSLAQHQALAQTGDAEKAEALTHAKRASAEEVSRDLARTQEQLARSLSLGVKNTEERDFHRFKGTLIAPVKQSPAHTWGPRQQGNTTSYVRHTGYTYLIDPGTPVRATAAGIIAYVATFEGYGNVVIIDHGAGYHSVYAHLQSFAVQLGQKVSRGDTLGESGESGSLEGPKLYFELRKGGEPINPADWFIRR